LRPKDFNEASPSFQAATLFGNVFENVGKVAPGRRQIRKPTHSVAGLGQLRFLRIERDIEIIVRAGVALDN
jgi:hypothetical protein